MSPIAGTSVCQRAALEATGDEPGSLAKRSCDVPGRNSSKNDVRVRSRVRHELSHSHAKELRKRSADVWLSKRNSPILNHRVSLLSRLVVVTTEISQMTNTKPSRTIIPRENIRNKPRRHTTCINPWARASLLRLVLRQSIAIPSGAPVSLWTPPSTRLDSLSRGQGFDSPQPHHLETRMAVGCAAFLFPDETSDNSKLCRICAMEETAASVALTQRRPRLPVCLRLMSAH